MGKKINTIIGGIYAVTIVTFAITLEIFFAGPILKTFYNYKICTIIIYAQLSNKHNGSIFTTVK